MKIYQVYAKHWEPKDPDLSEFFATKTEACKVAREGAAEIGEPVEVYECELKPGKAGIVALANSYSWWAAPRTVVYTAKPRKAKPVSTDDIDDLM